MVVRLGRTLYLTKTVCQHLVCKVKSDITIRLIVSVLVPELETRYSLFALLAELLLHLLVVPLLEQTPPSVTIWATDVSRRALEIVGEQLEKEHFHTIDGQGWRDRVSLFQYDAVRGVVGKLYSDTTDDDASESEIVDDRISLEPEGYGAATPLLSFTNSPPCQSLTGKTRATLAMFVLSAIPPSYHATTFKTLASTLQLGGLLCFRDYGLYDLAMLRADSVNVITNTLHRRGDGTLVTYFTPEQITLFMQDAGLTVDVSEYHTVKNTNRKKGVSMRRVFVHAVGRKT